MKAGSSVRVKVELDLPADVKKFTNCVLSFDGSAVTSPVEFKIRYVLWNLSNMGFNTCFTYLVAATQ